MTTTSSRAGGRTNKTLLNGAYWGILVNNVFTNVGGCQYELHAGDEVLWVYDALREQGVPGAVPRGERHRSPVRPLTATAELGKPFEVEVLDYGDDKEDKPPVEPERAGATPYAEC